MKCYKKRKVKKALKKQQERNIKQLHFFDEFINTHTISIGGETLRGMLA